MIVSRSILEVPEKPKGNIVSLPSHTAVITATFLGSPGGRCREIRLYIIPQELILSKHDKGRQSEII